MEPAEMAHAAEESHTTRTDFEYYEEKYDVNAVKQPEISQRTKNQVCNLEETSSFNFTAFATLAEAIFDIFLSHLIQTKYKIIN